MVYDTVVLDDTALVREEVLIVFCRIDEVGSLPLFPVDEVSRHGEGVIRAVFPLWVESGEIEHDIERFL